jgi:hypothetical protein
MNVHDLAKAAADATVPEDMDGVTAREHQRLWLVARDAALFALGQVERAAMEAGDAEMNYFASTTCACTAAQRWVARCPKHGFPPAASIRSPAQGGAQQ